MRGRTKTEAELRGRVFPSGAWEQEQSIPSRRVPCPDLGPWTWDFGHSSFNPVPFLNVSGPGCRLRRGADSAGGTRFSLSENKYHHQQIPFSSVSGCPRPPSNGEPTPAGIRARSARSANAGPKVAYFYSATKRRFVQDQFSTATVANPDNSFVLGPKLRLGPHLPEAPLRRTRAAGRRPKWGAWEQGIRPRSVFDPRGGFCLVP